MPLLSGKKMIKFSPHATPWKNLISVVSLFLHHSKLCHTKPSLFYFHVISSGTVGFLAYSNKDHPITANG